MGYPRININLEKISKNVQIITDLCKEKGVRVTGITKMVCGDYEIAKIFAENGVIALGDSRMKNLKKIKDIEIEKWLIRIPMPDEVSDVVNYTDVSLNSEIETIDLINIEAKTFGKKHKVILMIDLGDLREGFYGEDVIDAAVYISKLSNIELYGVGTNLNCFGFVRPTKEKMEDLVRIKEKIENLTNSKLQVVSGGNSSNLKLLMEGNMDRDVNNLRLGESLLFGRERSDYKYIENTYNDTFVLEAQIVELKTKPSVPQGEIGEDSWGNSPTFKDNGNRKKAIFAVGKQDIDPALTFPIDKDIFIIGGSGDHTIIDVTDSNRSYVVGDIVRFELQYMSALKAMTSEYVEKHYIIV